MREKAILQKKKYQKNKTKKKQKQFSQ